MSKYRVVSILNKDLSPATDDYSSSLLSATFEQPLRSYDRCAVIPYITPVEKVGEYVRTSRIEQIYVRNEDVMQFLTQNHLYTFVRMVG